MRIFYVTALAIIFTSSCRSMDGSKVKDVLLYTDAGSFLFYREGSAIKIKQCKEPIVIQQTTAPGSGCTLLEGTEITSVEVEDFRNNLVSAYKLNPIEESKQSNFDGRDQELKNARDQKLELENKKANFQKDLDNLKALSISKDNNATLNKLKAELEESLRKVNSDLEQNKITLQSLEPTNFLVTRLIDQMISQPGIHLVDKKNELFYGVLKSYVSPDQVGMVLVPIPGGSFKMQDKIPVTLKSFEIAETDLTQEKFMKLSGGKNPSHYKSDNRPVENISWGSAVMYAIELNKRLALPEPVDISSVDMSKVTGSWQNGDLDFGKEISKIRFDLRKTGYRLPTEAEMEYVLTGLGKYKASDYAFGVNEKDLGKYFIFDTWGTANVKSKMQISIAGRSIDPPAGNVKRWVLDSYSGNLPGGMNPLVTEENRSRVRRGGGCFSNPKLLRAGYRDFHYHAHRDWDIGVRFLRTANP